jgi:hypothetical protein
MNGTNGTIAVIFRFTPTRGRAGDINRNFASMVPSVP